MNLDDQISRSLAQRADQTAYDPTPLVVVERDAHGLRRRRRAAAALGVAAVVTVVVLPLAVVRGDSDTSTPPPATDPPARIVPIGPLGYLSKGLYHPSSGAAPIPVDVRDVTSVAEVGDDVFVISRGGNGVGYSRYTRIDPTGDVTDEGCTTGPPVTSPSGETVALVTITCPGTTGATGATGIVVSHGTDDTLISVEPDASPTVHPIVLGVDDAGDRVVYLAAERGPLKDLVADDKVRVIDAGTRSTVPGIHRALGYDPVNEVVFGSLPSTDPLDPYAYAGGAVTLDGEVLWRLDATSVRDPSPDGRFVVANDVSKYGEGFPPAPSQKSLHPRLLDATTGETVLELPEKTPGGGAILPWQRWDDTDHLLIEVFIDDEYRFVRIALDGTVTDARPGLASDDSTVIVESRSPLDIG